MAKHKTGNSVWPSEEPPAGNNDVFEKVKIAFQSTYLGIRDLSVYHIVMHSKDLTKWTAHVSTTGPDGHKLYYQVYHDGVGTCFVMKPEQPIRNADIRGIEF